MASSKDVTYKVHIRSEGIFESKTFPRDHFKQCRQADFQKLFCVSWDPQQTLNFVIEFTLSIQKLAYSLHRFLNVFKTVFKLIQTRNVPIPYSVLFCSFGIINGRGYGFMGGVPPPFDTLKIGTFTGDTKLKLYR